MPWGYVSRNFAVMPQTVHDPQTAPDLLSVAQAAKELSLANRTLHHQIANGKVVATKIGDGRTSAYVITRAEVDRVKADRDAA